MSVATYEGLGGCAASFEFDSEVISGSADCSGLFTTGEVWEGVTVSTEAPQWPIELSFRSPQVSDVFKLYAPGRVNTGGWEFVFDGMGNARVDQVSELAGWSGVLVSFSDQPFDVDVTGNLAEGVLGDE